MSALTKEGTLRDWHIDQLERCGYSEMEALALEIAGVDVQLIRDLVKAGCDLKTAAQIAT